MSKITIIEGNSSDKDNVRVIMVKGERGYSAYDIAVQNGYEGTEEEWKDSFLNSDNYYNKDEIDTSQAIQNSKISKKIYYFNTVADMKAYNLVSGDMAITSGYYEVNDGGGAEYKITDTISETKYQEEVGNLYAEIINLFSFKQMGKFEEDINVSDFNFLLKEEVDLENNNLVLTDTLELQNIVLKNGNISMGTSSSSIAPANQVCLLIKSNVTIENISFNDIDAYYTILSDRGSSNITIKNCKFIDNAFACVVFDVGNENLKVDNCYFNRIKYTDTSQLLYRYFIATGTKYTQQQNSDYTFSVRNVEFSNNIILNNPLWEGIDTHGGENIIIRNNYIENCKTGIMANASNSVIDNIKHKNIIIENNIVKGADNVTISGIIIGGTNSIMSENIKIVNNEFDNCSDNNNNFGAIKVWYARNSEIKNNKITNSKVRGINLGSKCINLKITNNYVENLNAAPIVQSGYAIINVEIVNNVLNGKNVCIQGFYNPLSGRGKFENNVIYGCNSNGINYPNNFNKSYNGSSNAYVNYDDILFDIATNVPLKVTSQYFALGKSSFDKIMSVNGSSGVNHVTCNIEPNELVNGLRILIGSDEYTVDYTIGNEIYLTSNTTSAYTNASVTPKAPTYSSFA